MDNAEFYRVGKSDRLLGDVDLGFAGRVPGNDPLHARLDRLDYGQRLQLLPVGSTWELRLADENLVVGRLSGKFAPPAAADIEARVESIIRRYHRQSRPEYAGKDKVDHWHVVVPTLTWTENATLSALAQIKPKPGR